MVSFDTLYMKHVHEKMTDVCCVHWREKLTIPADKPCIVLEGMGKKSTFVEWDDHASNGQSATFTTMASYSVVKSISFRVRNKCLLPFINYIALIIFCRWFFFLNIFAYTYSLYIS